MMNLKSSQNNKYKYFDPSKIRNCNSLFLFIELKRKFNENHSKENISLSLSTKQKFLEKIPLIFLQNFAFNRVLLPVSLV